jgi:hypothetical protein
MGHQGLVVVLAMNGALLMATWEVRSVLRTVRARSSEATIVCRVPGQEKAYCECN